MNLYIMTRGRLGAQRTWTQIPNYWRHRTFLVIPIEENHQHLALGGDPWGIGHYLPTVAVPDSVKNYSDKFKWIIEDGMQDGEEKAVIIDDDLIFSHQWNRPDNTIGLRSVEDVEQLSDLWAYMENLLDETALVGVHPRQMGHIQKPPFVENGKVVCVQGINRSLVDTIPDLNKFPILADVVLNATLLERGQGNKIITTFFQDWGSCQAPGGCSITRTPQMQAEACYWLEERFGPYIKAVKKTAKNNWLGGERVDFRGQWKKLYNAGVANLLDKGEGSNSG